MTTNHADRCFLHPIGPVPDPRVEYLCDHKLGDITAIPVLLAMLELAEQIVTVDAVGCQKGSAQKIRNQGGDYLLAVKDNQPRLHAKVQEAFAEAEAQGYATRRTTPGSGWRRGMGASRGAAAR